MKEKSQAYEWVCGREQRARSPERMEVVSRANDWRRTSEGLNKAALGTWRDPNHRLLAIGARMPPSEERYAPAPKAEEELKPREDSWEREEDAEFQTWETWMEVEAVEQADRSQTYIQYLPRICCGATRSAWP